MAGSDLWGISSPWNLGECRANFEHGSHGSHEHKLPNVTEKGARHISFRGKYLSKTPPQQEDIFSPFIAIMRLLLVLGCFVLFSLLGSGSTSGKRTAPKHSQLVETSTFGKFIGSPKYSVVVFFNPSALYYMTVLPQVEAAGEILSRTSYGASVQIGLVDGTLDTFLHFRYLPRALYYRGLVTEFTKFGIIPSPPNVIQLYRNGNRVAQYIFGEYNSSLLVKFVAINLAGGRVSAIPSQAASAAIPFPKVLACLQNDRLQALASDFPGEAFFERVGGLQRVPSRSHFGPSGRAHSV
jgi:hypothetical protein